MNRHLRDQTGRRRDAIDRLHNLTRGAMVAGAAGTVGFGILAATTFSGKATIDAAANGTQPNVSLRQATGGSSTTRIGSAGTVTDPGAAAVGQGFGTTPTPRPASGRQGHATSGGSG